MGCSHVTPIAVAALASLYAVACGGVADDRGLVAWLRVASGEYVAGAMPEATDGPPVLSVKLSTNTFYAGEIEKPLGGSLDPQATAVAIRLSDDAGYWIIPAGLPDVTAPKDPTFNVSLSFSENVPSGPHELVVRAVDAEGHFGLGDTEPLTAIGEATPSGALVIALRWDTETDLDLHVVDAYGAEIWKGNISSSKPPASGQAAATASDGGGRLDFDSNAACAIDGRRRENVVWHDPPPSGSYVVRVDTFSLCGQTFATWDVDASLDGVVVGRVQGESVQTDADMPHELGSGLQVLTFNVP